MEQPDDRELMDRVLLGDSRSFALIFDRHRDRVHRSVLRSTQTSSDAEDLTAIVFLELWRKRSSIHYVDGSALPWLLVTATNVARNAIRGRRRYRAFLNALPRPSVSPDIADAADAAIDAQSAASHLHSALDSLLPVDKNLIVLTSLEGLSLTDAASALGLSYGAAKTRLSRARSKLRSAHPDLIPVEAS